MTDSIEEDIDHAHAAAEGEAQKHSATDTHLSFGETLHRVTSAAKEAIDAHVSLARVRTSLVSSAAKWIAILGILAIITAFAMIVTLMVGALLALAPLWGLGLALLAVTGAALLVIALCGFGIRAQIVRIKGVIA